MIRAFLALLASLMMVSASPALARFLVSPIVIEVQEREGQYAADFLIANPRDKTLAVEIRVEERVFDANGGETLVPADDEFLIFPLQATIATGERQIVRLSYLGEISGQSRSFRLHVTEVLAPIGRSGSRGFGNSNEV